eukprot:1113512-Pyramimonas_sp.AAC.1
MWNPLARLVLNNSREIADLSASVHLRFEVEAGQGFVAASAAAGKAYDEESKQMRAKASQGET